MAMGEVRPEAADSREAQDRKLVYIQISIPTVEEYLFSV